jgi:hypothetical protein
MEKDFINVISESSTQLVSLNTMIPRKVREQLEECLGWLQTTEPLHKYSLQKTVQIAIENLHEALTDYYKSMDREVESEETTIIKLPIKPERKPFEGYEEFSNKTLYIKSEASRTVSSNRSDTKPLFLKNMGL